jgi:tRNA-Thr(GGU) m(6)t(6)A37 methyltransferase TsaA
MSSINSIAVVESCYTQKFATPRQAGLVDIAWARLKFPNTPFMQQALTGVDDFSHFWIIFGFHLNKTEAKAKIRTPKMSGKTSLYSTRSPHRPNNLGLSLVKLEKMEITVNHIFLHISGHDLVNGTPVFDIKPYIPAYDCPQAMVRAGKHSAQSQKIEQVKWNCSMEGLSLVDQQLIEETLKLDPRPRHNKTEEIFKALIAEINVEFVILQDQLQILAWSREHKIDLK